MTDRAKLIELAENIPPEAIEAACEARCLVPGTSWTDGTTEGVQAIERMLAERSIAAALRSLASKEEK